MTIRHITLFAPLMRGLAGGYRGLGGAAPVAPAVAAQGAQAWRTRVEPRREGVFATPDLPLAPQMPPEAHLSAAPLHDVGEAAGPGTAAKPDGADPKGLICVPQTPQRGNPETTPVALRPAPPAAAPVGDGQNPADSPAERFRAMAAVRFGRDGKPVPSAAPKARAAGPRPCPPGEPVRQPGDRPGEYQADGQAPPHQAR